ncbi:hypothetical protein MSG28_005469 [Choristoneura fumiferana]|uniref:Uncharacterized protein n=3 Tax=Choristoneura fumiferana TaxID=7141 RepID=A0ACC0L037_CHOFU|nr:hypothetical protein MSG28_005469 [Choristoneura fumiferana]KAI8441782.1 hypothetical protein MSG28_005469 [Choristoneura fumiferana]KAI8441783.1 hypothetical protein MSG28_005469 [Choristoneura fumiferana]
MTKRTVVNEVYKGLLESVSIPAELRERDGKRFATFGAVVPIHCCTEEEVPEWSRKTHHYCGIFTEDTLAPLGELAYVRVDENTAEKVFINRAKRMLVRSADGVLAQWRCAPSFESSNQYLPGTPIVNQVLDSPGLIYGAHSFPSRAALREHVGGLPPAHSAPPAAPVLHRAPVPRIVLVAANGRQVAHIYLQGVITDVEYL